MTFERIQVIRSTWTASSKASLRIDLQQIVYDIFSGIIEVCLVRKLQLTIKNLVESSSLTAILERHFANVHSINDAAKGPQV